jgi:hypothetical protein
MTGTACSSEALTPPEPDIRNPGAFVAVGENKLTLMRTLDALKIEGDTILFTTFYDVFPTTFEHARELAKGPPLPIRDLLVSVSVAQIQAAPHEVVWFRTLTKAERDPSP